MLNFDAIERATVASAPFKFMVAHGVLSAVDLAAVRADFPPIAKAGLFPLAQLSYGKTFARLLEDLGSPEFGALMSGKFGIELADRPAMITVRGQCHKRDGRIHADSRNKIATCILYLNDIWDESGGRLRMLRSRTDLNDYFAEVPPDGGTLAAYVRTDDSWHGHLPFVGERRYIMLNWMRSKGVLDRELARHHLSTVIKRHMPSIVSS